MKVNFPSKSTIQVLGEKEDEIAEKALKAGAEVVCEKVRGNLASVVGKDTKYPSRSTGRLEKALGISPVLMDGNGNHNIKVGFAEPRSDGSGDANAKIANVLEYGKSGQPAKPFLKPARSASRKACVSAMQETYEQEVKKL